MQPLGPTLLQIPDQRSEVAILESFTSQMFARRGGYGSNLGWSADVWLALQHAHVQCDVLFEEALLAGGLEGRKVMVMPECDVLTKTLVEKIAQWQKQGGKIVADEFLCPALKADAVLPSFKRVKKADVDKAKVLELAKTIAGLSLPAMAECDNPEIIVRTRKFGDATYVFVVNDLREFGNYVGQHGLVMENGLPSRGIVTLSANPASVYDLTRGTLLDSHAASGKAIWSVELGPCDGRIFMVVPQAIAQLKVDLPEQVKGGGAATVSIKILDAKAAAVRAVSPVRLDIRDANGKPAEGAGFYGAKNGTLTVELNIAPNDDPGVWQIDVRDLASGIETTKFLRVVKP